MITCRRCGRQLKSSKSQAREYGRDCLKLQHKEDAVNALADLGVKPDTIRKATEDLEDGAVLDIRQTNDYGRPLYDVVSSAGDTIYRTTSEECTCDAGIFSQYLCRHRVAVMIAMVA